MNPKVIQFSDYHEISFLEDELKGTGIKIKELNLDSNFYRSYPAILYEGSLKSDKVKMAITKWKRANRYDY